MVNLPAGVDRSAGEAAVAIAVLTRRTERPPTVREIATYLGLSSSTTAWRVGRGIVLRYCDKRGSGSRNIGLTKHGWDVAMQVITANPELLEADTYPRSKK